jgi:hypothetical protein
MSEDLSNGTSLRADSWAYLSYVRELTPTDHRSMHCRQRTAAREDYLFLWECLGPRPSPVDAAAPTWA